MVKYKVDDVLQEQVHIRVDNETFAKLSWYSKRRAMPMGTIARNALIDALDNAVNLGTVFGREYAEYRADIEARKEAALAATVQKRTRA